MYGAINSIFTIFFVEPYRTHTFRHITLPVLASFGHVDKVRGLVTARSVAGPSITTCIGESGLVTKMENQGNGMRVSIVRFDSFKSN